MAQTTYTAEQIAIAARELRQAAGTEEERFANAQAVDMLNPEIRLLRERGFDSQRIADLLNGFDIAVTPDDLKNAAKPVFAD